MAAPAQVTGVTITTGREAVGLMWTEPADGGEVITRYQVQRRTGTAAFSNSVSATGLRVIITGLTDGTEYDFRVRAVNDDGNGQWSDTISATPAGVDIEGKKVLEGLWASDAMADREDPEDEGIARQQGFGVSYEQVGSGATPERVVFNQRFREWDGFSTDVLRSNMPFPWDANIDYVAYAYVTGANGRIYLTEVPSGPSTGNAVDPTSEGQEVWRIY